MVETPEKTNIEWLFSPGIHAIVYSKRSWIYLKGPQYFALLALLVVLYEEEGAGRTPLLQGELVSKAQAKLRKRYIELARIKGSTPTQGLGTDLFRLTLWKANTVYVQVKAVKRATLFKLTPDGRRVVDEYIRRGRESASRSAPAEKKEGRTA